MAVGPFVVRPVHNDLPLKIASGLPLVDGLAHHDFTGKERYLVLTKPNTGALPLIPEISKILFSLLF
jgi:hypothetical protein